MTNRIGWRSAAAVGMAVGALAFAACGSDDDSDTTAATTGGGEASATTVSEGSAGDATAIVEEATADIAYEGPTSGPAPEPDKQIAVIPCAAAASGCVRVADGATEAAKQIGWKVRTLDGQGQASTQNSAIQQAVSQGVDGIVLVAIDSSSVSQGLAAAKQANIPVVSIQADNEVGEGANAVTAEPASGSTRAGEALGAFAVADSDGAAKVATLSTTELAVTRNRTDAFIEQVEACEGCEVVKQETYLLSSAIKDVPLKVSSMLQANPDIEYLFVDVGQFGALATQAIDQAGKDVKVLSVDCNPDDIENIANDTANVACAGHALETGGYAALAALNFAFADETAAAEELVVPTKLITADNLPSEPVWKGDFDPTEAYAELWGK